MSEYLIVYEQDAVFFDFAEAQLEMKFDRTLSRTLSHVRRNDDNSLTMLAVVVFNGWTPHSVEISIASSKGMWATKRFIRSVYEYAFTFAEKERIHMVVEPSNTDAVEMHKRLGHKYEGRLEDWFGRDKPVLVFGLTKRHYEQGKWSLEKGKQNES